jgi:lipopolysaccharide export system protein LptA
MLANEVNKESSSELSVEADISLEWFEKEKYYLAKGNVLLKKDGLTLKANIVKADYAVENGEHVLKKITAKEKVVLTKDKSEANGQFMTYDVAKKIAIISGKFQTFSSPAGYVESLNQEKL